MSRSDYVYLVTGVTYPGGQRTTGAPTAAFTVKQELVNWIKAYAPRQSASVCKFFRMHHLPYGIGGTDQVVELVWDKETEQLREAMEDDPI